VNLDDLRWDRPDLNCEPLQERGIPRNLQLDETLAASRSATSPTTASSTGCRCRRRGPHRSSRVARYAGRQSTTTEVPSARRAKKSGACEISLPASSRQDSQNGCEAMPPPDRKTAGTVPQKHQCRAPTVQRPQHRHAGRKPLQKRTGESRRRASYSTTMSLPDTDTVPRPRGQTFVRSIAAKPGRAAFADPDSLSVNTRSPRHRRRRAQRAARRGPARWC
jgi:hypothetical protein